MQEVIKKVMPIFILLAIGYGFRRLKIIDDTAVRGVKKIILNIAIPLLLFKIFFEMRLKIEYLLVICIAIVFYFLAYIAARLIRKMKLLNYRLLPYVSTGFAFALVGVPLFQIVFGENHLDSLSILGIANEIFVWVLLISFMKIDFKEGKLSWGKLVELIRSPLLICVVIGIVLNALGTAKWIMSNSILGGVYNTVLMLADITTPLILLVIGYDIVINKRYLFLSIKYVLVRLVVLFTLGYAVKFIVLDYLISDRYFDHAFFTLLTLPPSFGIQVIASQYCEARESELGNNIIVVSIIMCIMLFVGYTIILYAMGGL